MMRARPTPSLVKRSAPPAATCPAAGTFRKRIPFRCLYCGDALLLDREPDEAALVELVVTRCPTCRPELGRP